ncbi:MAG: YhfC family intramembrane metalloprotease [Sandaracinaceae bacterium]|nr:YhfC family intramembrane metalloprotease [Sandaracinaceae bacterium]
MLRADGEGVRYDLIATTALAALLNLGMPVALALVLKRRLGTRWWLFVLGALSFVASQVVHMPLLYGATAAFRSGSLPQPPDTWWWFSPVFLGLAAGACEEPARWLAFRVVLRREEDRGREAALMVGAGHGGVESIFIGLLVPLTLVNMIVMRGLSGPEVAALSFGSLDAAAAEQTAAQVAEFWAAPFWTPLLSAFERAMTIPFHVAMSALVAYGVRARKTLWALPLAIGLHALVDAFAVYAAPRWSAVTVELALFAIVAPVAAAALVLTWRAQRAAAAA